MFPYILFTLLVLLLYCFKKPAGILIVMIAFSVLRYDVGWDYISYYEICRNSVQLGMAEDRYSFVWNALFNFAYTQEIPHLGIAIPAVFTYLILYVALRIYFEKNKLQISDALLVYCFWPFFYLSTFSTIRQNLAISIALLIVVLIQNRKIIPAILLLIVNYYIHPSSVIVLLYFPVCIVQRRMNSITIILSILGLTLCLKSLDLIIGIIDIPELNMYREYLNMSDGFGSKLSVLLGMLVIFLLMTYYRGKEMSVRYSQSIVIVIIAFTMNILIYNIGLSDVITRIVSYFSILLIVVLYPALKIYKSEKLLRPILTCLLVALFFIYLNITTNAHGLSSSTYVPYQTILENH